MSKSVKKIIKQAYKNESTHLNLSFEDLTEIPEEVYELTNLETLYLKNNNISKIEGLEKLTNLKLLSLDDNKISKIEGLEQLTNLKWLYL